MTQIQTNKAYLALTRLCELRFSFKKSRELYNLTILLKTIFDFGAKEEIKIIQNYNGTICDNGVISFEGIDKRERSQNCTNELKELQESEVELVFKPITLTEADYGNQEIIPSDIGNLNGFIIFE